MVIVTGVGTKFIEELPLGIHKLAEGAPSDIIKVALYGPNAVLNPSLLTYTTTGEVTGGGYTAGGVTQPLIIVGKTGSSRAGGVQFGEGSYIQPTTDTSIVFTGGATRGVLMYNSSQSNRMIFVLDFGANFTPSSGVKITWGVAGVVLFSEVLIPLLGTIS